MQRYETSTVYRICYFLQQHRKLALLAALVLVALTVVPSSILAAVHVIPDNQPGTNGNKTRLINNWTITPAGKQTALGDWPVNSVLSPNGRDLLVVNSGAGIQSLQVVDTASSSIIQTIPYSVPDSVFVGLAYSPDGNHAYAAGGGAAVVHIYNVLSSGKLAATGNITIGTHAENPFPTGLSISPDGKTLYVANNLANNVAVVDTVTGKIPATVKIGTYPYTTLVSKDGKTVYASNWGDATVSVISGSTAAVVATIKTGNHPTAMAFGPDHLLFVTDGNTDAISVIDTATNKELRTISLAPYKNAPLSSSPMGLTVSANQKYLYVSDAGENAVAVIALNGASGPEKLVGRIPTAWYPTSVITSKDGTSLFITNGYGRGAGPNNKGVKKLYPNPTRQNPPIVDGVTGYNNKYCNCTFDNYSGSMTVGTLSTVTIPGKGLLDLYSAQVASNDHVGDTSLLQRDAGNPIPLPGGSSPIKHVIYIVKENRTYDQVFGDESVGNNDPSLTLFPSANTPNLHALADRQRRRP